MPAGLTVVDVDDEARAHAPSLHRTALMLTGSPSAAVALVVQALRQLPAGRAVSGSAGRGPDIADKLRADLVRYYLRGANHYRPEPGMPYDVKDPFLTLAALPRRQRAGLVLLAVERWSPDRAAPVLGVSLSRVPGLIPRDPALADALEAIADQLERPNDEVVADVVASLGERPDADDGRVGGRRAGAADQQATRRTGRRLAVLAALLVGGAVATTSLDAEPDISAPTTTRTDRASPTVPAVDRWASGWVLDERGGPPRVREGLRLVQVTSLDYVDGEALTLDTRPHGAGAAFAVLWCDIPVVDVNIEPPAATLQLSGQTVLMPCAGKSGAPAVQRLVPLPPPLGNEPVSGAVSWTGDVPGEGTAVLATYHEVPGDAGRPAPLSVDDDPPPVAPGATALDQDLPHLTIGGLDDGAVGVFVRRLSVSDVSDLAVWVDRTGAYSVLVDGLLATDDGDVSRTAGARTERRWWDQDPELRNGTWTVQVPGRAREFALPTGARPGPGEQREVSVQVQVQGARDARWQVQVTDAGPVETELEPLPMVTTDAPEVFLHRPLVGAWEVPVDAHPHPLITPASLSADAVFVTEFPTGEDVATLGWEREAVITSDLGTVSLPSGWSQDQALFYLQAWPGWGPAAQRPDGVARLGEVSVSILGHSSTLDHATVLAYGPPGG